MPVIWDTPELAARMAAVNSQTPCMGPGRGRPKGCKRPYGTAKREDLDRIAAAMRARFRVQGRRRHR